MHKGTPTRSPVSFYSKILTIAVLFSFSDLKIRARTWELTDLKLPAFIIPLDKRPPRIYVEGGVGRSVANKKDGLDGGRVRRLHNAKQAGLNATAPDDRLGEAGVARATTGGPKNKNPQGKRRVRPDLVAPVTLNLGSLMAASRGVDGYNKKMDSLFERVEGNVDLDDRVIDFNNPIFTGPDYATDSTGEWEWDEEKDLWENHGKPARGTAVANTAKQQTCSRGDAVDGREAGGGSIDKTGALEGNDGGNPCDGAGPSGTGEGGAIDPVKRGEESGEGSGRGKSSGTPDDERNDMDTEDDTSSDESTDGHNDAIDEGDSRDQYGFLLGEEPVDSGFYWDQFYQEEVSRRIISARASEQHHYSQGNEPAALASRETYQQLEQHQAVYSEFLTKKKHLKEERKRRRRQRRDRRLLDIYRRCTQSEEKSRSEKNEKGEEMRS